MATINFLYRGKSERGNLTIRLKHSTSIDYRISSKIVSHRKFWYKTNNKHRKLAGLSYLGAEAKAHKSFLDKFQDNILSRFKTDFNKGIPISKEWLKNNINEVSSTLDNKKDITNAQTEINQKKEKKLQQQRSVYSKNLVTSAIQRVIDVEYFNNKEQIKIYKQLLNKISNYQTKKKVELNTKDITQNFIDEFTAFLMTDLMHQVSTARKHCKSLVHSVKYQKKAFPEVVKIAPNIGEITYKKQSPSEKRKKRTEIVVTLSFDELNQIHNTDIPTPLMNAKKVILFGCEFGLRVSDYSKLTEDNIVKNGDMEYWSFWNQKTGFDIVIPITNRIKKYIECYGMPKTKYTKAHDVIINREIKEVCRLAGINEEIQGRKSQPVIINGKKTRRTIAMKYPKYEIITMHCFRRSFATNYYKTLENSEIRQVTGHTSDTQLMEYINENKDRTQIIEQMTSKMNANQSLKEKENQKATKLKVLKNASNEF